VTIYTPPPHRSTCDDHGERGYPPSLSLVSRAARLAEYPPDARIGAVCQLARHSPMRFKPGKASQDQRDRRKPALPAPSPTPVTTIHDVVSGPISPASAVIEPYLIDRQGALFVLAIERLKSRMCRPSETRRRGRKHDSRRRDGRNENDPHSANRPYWQR
jgi:hypothetical protein